MAPAQYVVKSGDTLSEIIAECFPDLNTTQIYMKVVEVAALNKIPNPDNIAVGQVIKFSGSSTVSTPSKGSANVHIFGIQSNTERTLMAAWEWGADHTDHYEIWWQYDTGDGIWFGDKTTTESKHSTYDPPANAKVVRFIVRPIAEEYGESTKTVWWTATKSTAKKYSFDPNPPTTPSAPTVTVKKYQLTAELDNVEVNYDSNNKPSATGIQFQIVVNDRSVFKTGNASIVTNHAAYSCTINAGDEYKVRCRSYKGGVKNRSYSDWSDYSSNVSSVPAAVKEFSTIKATSDTSVLMQWVGGKNAESYEIQYTTDKKYFSGSDQLTTESGITTCRYELTGLESGQEYFFRVRSVNSQGEATWSKASSIILGKKPAAPTTWSSSTTAIAGESLTLYWVHNAEDGSSQTVAELELSIGGVITTETIKNSTEEDEKDKTSSYSIDTSAYNEGVAILWRVRTAGITNEYGDWSVQRTVDIYAPPTLDFRVTNVNAEPFDILESFPFYVYGLAGPNTQVPVGYHLTVTSNEVYETIDNIGNKQTVNVGEDIYSKYFDTSDPLLVELSAGNIDLANNVNYTVTCVVTMNSGLTAEGSADFTVGWTENTYIPDAEIGIDPDTIAAHIRPYCTDDEGNLIEDVSLSVYRREFDGSFTEIITGIDNLKSIFVTDPHPALDFARYRIVAIANATGAVGFYDAPGYIVGEKSVVIQWDEEWTAFDSDPDVTRDIPPWTGSMLKLPYDIDVSDSYKPDTKLVEYIGRSHPTSYYGTQLGSTSTWNVVIPKNDEETLYAIRRLAIWMGDVYVREPSGSGYWANIVVSYNQTHDTLTIPITFDITRVEGGM